MNGIVCALCIVLLTAASGSAGHLRRGYDIPLFETVSIHPTNKRPLTSPTKVSLDVCVEERDSITVHASKTDHTIVGAFPEACTSATHPHVHMVNMTFGLAGDFSSISANQHAEVYFFLGDREGHKYELGACSTSSRSQPEHCKGLDTSLDRGILRNDEDVHVVFARSLFVPSTSDWTMQVNYSRTCCRA